MLTKEGINSTGQKIEQAFLIQQRMIEYLAKKAWKHGFGESLPDAKYCKKLDDKACDFECWKCWINEAFDKAVQDADGK